MHRSLSLLLLAACASNEPSVSASPPIDPPNPNAETQPIAKTKGPQPIDYHDGWIVTWDAPVYFIYYGNWLDDSGQWTSYGATAWTIEHFTSQLGGSSWFSINSFYDDAWNNWATNQVHVGGRTSDRYSRGTSIAGGDMHSIVDDAIAGGGLPDDQNGIYVVLTTPDVTTDGFCAQHCGWHASETYGSERLLYTFVGDGARCPNNCGTYSPSPNNDPDGDEMVNVLGHELSEIVTDPFGDGWYSNKGGQENADHCAWNFGPEFTEPNGANANVTIGDSDYLIQQNWVPAMPGYCAQGA
jgi:hypothetical protein